VQTLGMNTIAQEELSRAGASFVEIAGIYQGVDGEIATTLA
jgi:hypothetical protein